MKTLIRLTKWIALTLQAAYYTVLMCNMPRNEEWCEKKLEEIKDQMEKI